MGTLAPHETSCAIFIDIRPGQVLQVAYDYSGNQPMTHEQACEKARGQQPTSFAAR